MKTFNIPKEVTRVTGELEKAGFEAFLVGGCVRDLVLGRVPKDWDVTTNAVPEEIIALFSKTFYENTFGTVGVVNEECEDESLKVVEVTPYRIEGNYTDNRHPDNVVFSLLCFTRNNHRLVRRGKRYKRQGYSNSRESSGPFHRGWFAYVACNKTKC